MFSTLLHDGKTFLILLLLSIMLLILDNFAYLNIPKSWLQTVTIPVQFGFYKTSNAVFKQFEFVILARRSAQENKAMTEQFAQVLSENARLTKKLAETESFLNQQKTLDSQTFNMVAARPIGMSRFLLLDKGSDDGIKVGQTVLYKYNFIGEIKEVSPKKSKVLTGTDPDSKIAAYVANDSGKARGILSGQFGSEMLLDKILHHEPIQKGDLIYSEGTEGRIPRGLILGQVIEVLDRQNEVFKQAKAKAVFDVTNLDIVFIITN